MVPPELCHYDLSTDSTAVSETEMNLGYAVCDAGLTKIVAFV
jgi:hypothetical protein